MAASSNCCGCKCGKSTEDLVIEGEKIEEGHPRLIIPELCELMYHQGWMTGTGGGMSIKKDEKIYIAPSGVQKERMKPEDLFCYTLEGKEISRPQDKSLRASSCTPLFFNAFNMREAGAVVHTHSQAAVLVTLINSKVFRITHQEMIKGIKRGFGAEAVTLNNYDVLVVPIVDNTPQEEDLKEAMAAAMREYPGANALLVRRHGVFVWGPTWERAKAATECYDYLFEIAIKMRQLGLDPAEIPSDSPYKHLSTEEKPVSS